MWQYNDTLQHYGILGMKWGVRRYQNADGTRTELGKKRERSASKTKSYHQDYVTSRDRKSVKQMSDAELRQRINRLQMEQQYEKLEPNTINEGKKYASKAMKGLTMAATLTTTAITLYNNKEKIKSIINK